MPAEALAADDGPDVGLTDADPEAGPELVADEVIAAGVVEADELALGFTVSAAVALDVARAPAEVTTVTGADGERVEVPLGGGVAMPSLLAAARSAAAESCCATDAAVTATCSIFVWPGA